MNEGNQHDHDRESGKYWSSTPVPDGRSTPRRSSDDDGDADGRRYVDRIVNEFLTSNRRSDRTDAYWQETKMLVREYFVLQVGSEEIAAALWPGFVIWLTGSPAALDRYAHRDDVARAELVDLYVQAALSAHRP
jgi:hypothetical protein